MKRSELNAIILDAERFFSEQGFRLPPFAFWTPGEWRGIGPEADGIRKAGLGWDVTDFGRGEYRALGLVLFTLRNGDAKDPMDTRHYAEKAMLVGDNQVTPWHFHWQKTEDIINRAGGTLVIELAWATGDTDELDDRPIDVWTDGTLRAVEPGGAVELAPGESVTLPPRMYHTFYGRSGGGRVLVGEVSNVNDDATDNRFLEPVGRFPVIEEDEPPYRMLCNEYPPAPS